jgi:hypothetical protein
MDGAEGGAGGAGAAALANAPPLARATHINRKKISFFMGSSYGLPHTTRKPYAQRTAAK